MKVSRAAIWAAAGLCVLGLVALGVHLTTATTADTSKSPARPGVLEYAADPSFSPDGRFLAYVKNDDLRGGHLAEDQLASPRSPLPPGFGGVSWMWYMTVDMEDGRPALRKRKSLGKVPLGDYL